MEFNEEMQLRGGKTPWNPPENPPADPLPATADIAIVGAGVMGAMLAERLSADGHGVVLVDSRPPCHGATLASTALVMWAADVPLSHLAREVGFDEAAGRWRAVRDSVEDLDARIDRLGIDCGWIDRPEVYVAGGLLDEAGLKQEEAARQRAGLPSGFLAAGAVHERFAIAPRAALLSGGSREVDPARLTAGLLAAARANGARICHPVRVQRLSPLADGVSLLSDAGELRARHVILAAGYEAPRWFLPPAFTLTSSFAIATAPGVAPLWRENALIWEAATPYLYGRATADGRLVFGGEDEDFADPEKRDALIAAKQGRIEALAGALVEAEISADCAWAATFGSSPDGLPAIGAAANFPNVWLAAGFGGNGISFASLGARLLAAELAGRPLEVAPSFSPLRFRR